MTAIWTNIDADKILIRENARRKFSGFESRHRHQPPPGDPFGAWADALSGQLSAASAWPATVSHGKAPLATPFGSSTAVPPADDSLTSGRQGEPSRQRHCGFRSRRAGPMS